MQAGGFRIRDNGSLSKRGRFSEQIPLPKLSDEFLEGQVEDVKARVNLSSDALPSAIFFTFVNTHKAMNCSAITRDCSLVAGKGPQAETSIQLTAACEGTAE